MNEESKLYWLLLKLFAVLIISCIVLFILDDGLFNSILLPIIFLFALVNTFLYSCSLKLEFYWFLYLINTFLWVLAFSVAFSE